MPASPFRQGRGCFVSRPDDRPLRAGNTCRIPLPRFCLILVSRFSNANHLIITGYITSCCIYPILALDNFRHCFSGWQTNCLLQRKKAGTTVGKGYSWPPSIPDTPRATAADTSRSGPASRKTRKRNKTEEATITYGNEGPLFAKRATLRSMQRSMVRGGVESMRSEVLNTLQNRTGNGSSTLLNNLGGSQGYDLYA